MKFMLIIMWSYWTECYQNDLFKEALTLPNYYSIAENGISSRGLEKGVSSTLQMISRVNIVPSPKTGVLASESYYVTGPRYSGVLPLSEII